METISREDALVNKELLSKLQEDLLSWFPAEFNIEKGPVIAGGSIRRLFTKHNDIDYDYDIFFNNELQLCRFQQRLEEKLQDFCLHYYFRNSITEEFRSSSQDKDPILFSTSECKETDNAVTYILQRPPPTVESTDEIYPYLGGATMGKLYKAIKHRSNSIRIQLIKRYYFDNLEQLFSNFDFTICQFASDGEYIYCPTNSLDDTLNKRLVVNPLATNMQPYRYLKFLQSGFVFNEPIIEIVEANNKRGVLIPLGGDNVLYNGMRLKIVKSRKEVYLSGNGTIVRLKNSTEDGYI